MLETTAAADRQQCDSKTLKPHLAHRSKDDSSAAQQQVERLNGVLMAMYEVGRVITSEKNQDRLLQAVCDKLVGARGYYNAWIALLDESGKSTAFVSAGIGKRGELLAARMRRGHHVNCMKHSLDQCEPWSTSTPSLKCRDCPLAEGYSDRGAISVRLEYRSRVYGVLTLSIPQGFEADDDEKQLIAKLAADVAFALNAAEERALRLEAERGLRMERDALTAANSALRVVLSRIEEEKQEVRDVITANIDRVLMPLIDALQAESPQHCRGKLDLVKTHLEDVTSPFVNRISRDAAKLTPAEVEICNMIRRGLGTKEIAKARHASPATVARQRARIRRKLGLTKTGANLTSHLTAFDADAKAK